MKGIIRKRVLALLSAVGLVGSTTSLKAQVVQGDEATKTKTESKIKADKNKQETTAGTLQANHKDERTNADAASKDAIKFRKANSEKSASKDVIRHKDSKASADAAGVKEKSTVKSTNAKSEKNAAQSDANKKANQASPK